MTNRKKSLLALGVGTLVFINGARADNPLIMDQFTADPTARLFNGKIYLYPSHDMPAAVGRGGRGGGGWFAMEDYHVFSSENLLDWKDRGVIVDQKQVPWVRGASNSMWAPDCVEKDGRYYFYFPASNQIGVAIADKPEGPYTVEPQYLVGGIDPVCFIDTAGAKDGKKPDAYLVWKGNPLTVAKLREDMKSLDPTTAVRLPNLPTQGNVEGPFMFERKGIYYLTYPHAVTINGHEAEVLEYAMGKTPTGPFTVTGVIMDQTPAPIGQTPRPGQTPAGCWTNHHSLVEYQGQWILFYHANDLSPDFDKNRSARADYVSFEDDGKIKKVIPTFRGVGVADAKRKIQIDRCSAVSKEGTAVSFLNAEKKGDGWKIALTEKNAFVQYDRVDFGKAPLKAAKIRALSSTGGTIEIHLDKTDGPLIAKVVIPKGDEWKEIVATLATPPSEQHDLVVTMPEKNAVEIDWVSFE